MNGFQESIVIYIFTGLKNYKRNKCTKRMYKVILHKAGYVALLLLILQSAVFAQEQPKKIVITLPEAIKTALDKNWDVRLSDKDVRKAEEQINEAYSNAYPTISFSGSYNRYLKTPVMFIPPHTPYFNETDQTSTLDLTSKNSFDASVTLTQVLYSQKVNTAIKIADEYASYSQTAAKNARNETILTVKKAFYGVLLAQAMLDVSKKNFESADATFKNVQSQYKQGVASEYDALRSEVQRANAQPLLIQTENAVHLAKDYLKSVMAIDIATEIDVQGAFIFEDVPQSEMEESSDNALGNSLILKQLSINESLLKKNLTIERSEYYPTLAAFGKYDYQTQDNSFNFRTYLWAPSFVVGVQLSYPIFDGFKRGARIEQAKIEIEKVGLMKKKAEDGIKIQVKQARMKMDEAKKRIDAQVKNLEQAEKTLSIAQTRYKSGIGTQLEIIDTQAALVYARTNHAQAIYDYLVAKADWEYAVTKEQ
jgi:outer membrane protein TolC